MDVSERSRLASSAWCTQCSDTDPRSRLAISPSTAGSDHQQVRSLADIDKHISGGPITNLTLAHELGLELLDLGQGLVHDGAGCQPGLGPTGHDRPGHHVGGLLVGAHDLEERTAQRRLVSSKPEGSRAAFGAIDADHDTEFAVVTWKRPHGLSVWTYAHIACSGHVGARDLGPGDRDRGPVSRNDAPTFPRGWFRYLGHLWIGPSR